MGWVARVCRRVMLAAGGLMVLGLNLVAAPALDELGIVSATVEVELSCPSCARGLERRLNHLDDVGAVEIRAVSGSGSRLKISSLAESIHYLLGPV